MTVVFGKDVLAPGDACEVVDLRTGTQWTAVVEKGTVPTDPKRVVVKRDSDGALVRVGVGFVRLLP